MQPFPGIHRGWGACLSARGQRRRVSERGASSNARRERTRPHEDCEPQDRVRAVPVHTPDRRADSTAPCRIAATESTPRIRMYLTFQPDTGSLRPVTVAR